MTRALVVTSLVAWVGLVLLLADRPWFARRHLADRLRAHAPDPARRVQRVGLLSVESFRQVVAPLAQSIGGHGAHLLGIEEDLATRLRRVHSAHDVTSFRVRQVGMATAVMGAAALLAVALRPAGPIVALLLLGTPLLAFLLAEQQLASASDAWKRRLHLEMPVVAEQLGMLLSSGWSLHAAMHRVAQRGSGAIATDLATVVRRVRHGLSDEAALREWQRVAATHAVDRLVSVLVLHREASDLGRLVADEARAIRREVQRELIATVERRAQQVWIPVTVATLVPGVIFISIPFLRAMQRLT